jgi:membrane protease YdiL (CAAX protease family)
MTEKVILALLLFLFSYLFASFLSQWNKGISLPQSLSGIEQAMRSMEDAALETTDLLLSVDTIGGLLLNLLIVAGFAALSEELFFRGALQQLLQEKFRNGHAAVWVAAFIFSIVHFQFYGFLPRLFLGALLGYLFLYTRNLWIPILFHFINNATVLVISYFWRDAGWLRKMEEMPVTLPFVAGAVASLLLTFLLFWSYNKKTATRSKPTDNSV